jgi:hypothetical protein
MNMSKQSVCVRMPKYIIERVDEYCEGQNFSERLVDFCSSEIHWKDYYQFKIDYHQSQIKKLKELLSSNMFTDKYKLPEDQLKYLKDTLLFIKDRPDKLYPRCTAFNTIFTKTISIKEFKLLLEKVKNE